MASQGPLHTRRARGKTPRQQPGHRKSRGLTCSKCRTRKVRCDGAQPACKMCELYNDDCSYDKPPSMSLLLAMAKRLQEAEQTIADLRSGEVSGRDEITSPTITTFSPVVQYSPPGYQQISTADAPPLSKPTNHSISNNTTTNGTWNGVPGASPQPSRTPKQPSGTELMVDEHGNTRYYGPTSAVREPSLELSSPNAGTMQHSPAQQTSGTHSSLAAHARESAIWEEFAVGNASLQTDIPRQVIAKLLHIHFTWVGPPFLWVHRSAFVRDMATGGSNYSEFLLLVLCAHAARYLKDSSADMLLNRARALIGNAIQQSSSVPTIQALLQLSASELAQGSISQTWIYSGIAFRMASDLGLQYSGAVKGLNSVDLEVRRRLYWSCYFWDKTTSLYTGRMPSITESPDEGSLIHLESAADADTWVPYFGDSVNLCKLPNGRYPPMSNHIVACFVNSCKLAVIINDMITRIYHRLGQGIIETSFKDIRSRLDSWRAQSPVSLRYDPEDLPSISPPPHVISQNLLYFASIILTHRPFWLLSTDYQICVQAAHAIEALVVLFESTFDLCNITYLLGYCIYTGASVLLEEAKKNSNSAQAVLGTFLRALNSGMRRCRLLERSLNIIVKEMGRLQPTTSQSSFPERSSRFEASSAIGTYVPAFPFVDVAATMDFDMDPYFDRSDALFMHSLDSFPEMQMDLGSIFDAGSAAI
ncbi:hypothetical protein EK21DRAFT_105276 [Setomelanomma holmii]|uniref:Zn(2)-C6 fungal-type domain-containing protein n=1 Tax=Setomelanomma holmii TaxID=210430 RepID=A0A9P4GXV3_9PLEO|nr:hypothetical protein EK21DRAFT_105276 [Setomelanomma holmii]